MDTSEDGQRLTTGQRDFKSDLSTAELLTMLNSEKGRTILDVWGYESDSDQSIEVVEVERPTADQRGSRSSIAATDFGKEKTDEGSTFREAFEESRISAELSDRDEPVEVLKEERPRSDSFAAADINSEMPNPVLGSTVEKIHQEGGVKGQDLDNGQPIVIVDSDEDMGWEDESGDYDDDGWVDESGDYDDDGWVEEESPSTNTSEPLELVDLCGKINFPVEPC